VKDYRKKIYFEQILTDWFSTTRNPVNRTESLSDGKTSGSLDRAAKTAAQKINLFKLCFKGIKTWEGVPKKPKF